MWPNYRARFSIIGCCFSIYVLVYNACFVFYFWTVRWIRKVSWDVGAIVYWIFRCVALDCVLDLKFGYVACIRASGEAVIWVQMSTGFWLVRFLCAGALGFDRVVRDICCFRFSFHTWYNLVVWFECFFFRLLRWLVPAYELLVWFVLGSWTFVLKLRSGGL